MDVTSTLWDFIKSSIGKEIGNVNSYSEFRKVEKELLDDEKEWLDGKMIENHDKTGNESNSSTYTKCCGCNCEDYCIWSNKWNCFLCEECKFNLG